MILSKTENISEEQIEIFHQHISTMESWYQRKYDRDMNMSLMCREQIWHIIMPLKIVIKKLFSWELRSSLLTLKHTVQQAICIGSIGLPLFSTVSVNHGQQQKISHIFYLIIILAISICQKRRYNVLQWNGKSSWINKQNKTKQSYAKVAKI